jgi:hypothetical protein
VISAYLQRYAEVFCMAICSTELPIKDLIHHKMVLFLPCTARAFEYLHNGKCT